jgi:DNA ligase (NAD+)
LTVDEARREIGELSDALRKYNHEYHVLAAPSVSDLEYDRLFDRLKNLEEQYPELVRPDSPVRRIGSDLSSDLPEAAHSIPVLSLDKAYTSADIDAWIQKTIKAAGMDLTFTIEEKIDGVSIVLYYENGSLVRAITRGNGYVGNDVTANVMTVRTVPLRLRRDVTVAVRGEIYLPVAKFEELNSKMETPYANPRNLAAGSL